MADERYVTGILWQRTGGPEEGQSGAGKGTAFRVLFLAIHAMRPSLRAHVLNPAGPCDPPGPGRRKYFKCTFLRSNRGAQEFNLCKSVRLFPPGRWIALSDLA